MAFNSRVEKRKILNLIKESSDDNFELHWIGASHDQLSNERAYEIANDATHKDVIDYYFNKSLAALDAGSRPAPALLITTPSTSKFRGFQPLLFSVLNTAVISMEQTIKKLHSRFQILC
ncbi:hypothetical protein AVEN_151971-1 [Araneus ventricosus]|uniref:Uncharacterized protein n=1 Tax=Araneus ventricosus TaxID=182803 RepID=A0A4Y2NAV1_ARAVE|nr:hypothetical protein AVEN_151971-1 [Araneus ventricosus]